MDIKPCGSVPVATRAGELVHREPLWQDPIIEAAAPARLRAVVVRFDPGARTAWHTHPLGQTLYIVTGCGRVQSWAARSAKSAPVMWFGSRRAKSTGTAQVQRRECRI
jgi:quercetin dioxygenase-like cupin family protein